MQYLTMTQKEVNRYAILQKLINKEINGPYAAKLIGLSIRQTKRLKAKVKKHGPKVLIHASRGKSGNRSISPDEKKEIIELLQKHYSDFKPGFAAEKLAKKHHLKRDPKTIRKIMIDQGLWKPRKKKLKDYHSWRQRKAAFGEMEQFDGSYEYWFEDRGPYCCLLASIDDATGIPTKAKFAFDEGVFPVFDFWRAYLKEYGKPYSIYLDKFSTYKMSQKVAQENHDTLTQFQRAMRELGTEPITAHSCQAKGRIERLFKTFQDRLIKEMRLANISTLQEGNDFLEKTFLPQYRAKYAVEPRSKTNLHKHLSQKEKHNLDAIFSRQYTRIIRNDFTISFNKQWYQLLKDQPATICKKDTVTVEERLDGTVHFRLRGKYLNYKILAERPKKIKVPWVIAANKKPAYAPSADHPWRKSFLVEKARKTKQSVLVNKF